MARTGIVYARPSTFGSEEGELYPRRRRTIRNEERGDHLTNVIPRQGDWWKRALCVEFVDDPTMDWSRGQNARSMHVAERLVCAHCPVAVECLDEAMQLERGYTNRGEVRYGLRGGLTGSERRHLVTSDITINDSLPSYLRRYLFQVASSWIELRRERWLGEGAA